MDKVYKVKVGDVVCLNSSPEIPMTVQSNGNPYSHNQKANLCLDKVERNCGKGRVLLQLPPHLRGPF